jgi:hypothetical protein
VVTNVSSINPASVSSVILTGRSATYSTFFNLRV